MLLSVGVALPATPVAGVTTVKLTVPVVAVRVFAKSLVNTDALVVVATAPWLTVIVSLLAFMLTNVMVAVLVVVPPKLSIAV